MSQPKLKLTVALESLLSPTQLASIQPLVDTLTDRIIDLHSDCNMALDGSWDAGNDGFEAMISNIEEQFDTPPEYVGDYQFDVDEDVVLTEAIGKLVPGMCTVVSRDGYVRDHGYSYTIRRGKTKATAYEHQLS